MQKRRLVVASSLLTTALLMGSTATIPAAQAANSATNSVQCRSCAIRPMPHLANVPFSIRLEDQILAVLRYLPVKFQPTVRAKRPPAPKAPTTTTTKPPATTTTLPITTTTSTSGSTTTVPVTSTTRPTTTTTHPVTTTTRRTLKIIVAKPLSPTTLQSGKFIWRFRSLPPELRAQWRVGTLNVVLRGALMRFQSVVGLPTSGNMDTPTWTFLLRAALAHHYDPTSYNNVIVNQKVPQTLQLFVNGRVVYTTLVNTGIALSPTANGTYPVYLRYVTTTMSGTNPDGTHYHDTGIPWVSYFNGGDGLHGFVRSSYGYPQSLGCVEMPFSHAGVVWPRTPIGTLVTVR